MNLNFNYFNQVCVLCGPQPSLSELEMIVVKHWRSAVNLLNSMPRVHPASGHVDRSILGYILVNTDKKRLISGMVPQQKDSRSLSLARRLDISRTFYRTVVGAVLPSCATPSPHVLELGGTLLPDHASHTKVCKGCLKHGEFSIVSCMLSRRWF